MIEFLIILLAISLWDLDQHAPTPLPSLPKPESDASWYAAENRHKTAMRKTKEKLKRDETRWLREDAAAGRIRCPKL